MIIQRKRNPAWFLFLFLIYSSSFLQAQLNSNKNENSLVEKALKLQLDKAPQWQALLHLYKSKPQIQDSQFYEVGYFKNSQTELISSINGLTNDYQYRCRFPARFFWLSTKLQLSNFDFSKCNNLNEFLERAPADKISVIFASENITQPSSMMGHIFLKISGTNNQKVSVDHAISFYTELTNINILNLVYESLITGKEGFYTLSPYAPIKNNYLYLEQRNLWEYQLNLDAFTQKLILLHLYELKRIKFNYFFHSFNCSTLIHNILSIAFPQIQKERGLWVTPLDVVRSIDKSSYISTRFVTPSSKWKTRAIQQILKASKETLENIRNEKYDQLESLQIPKQNLFLTYELSLSHNNYLFEKNMISKEKWNQQDDFLNYKKNLLIPDGEIDVSEYKKPSATPQDTQVEISHFHDINTSMLKMSFIPASHSIDDDNSQYTNESELKILSPTLDYEINLKKLSLNSLVLYSAQSFQPSDFLISTLSGKIRFGYEPNYSNQLKLEKGLFFEVALGKTSRLHHDLDYYFLAGGGYNQIYENFFIKPELGMIIREIFNMKSHISLASTQIKQDGYQQINSFNFVQSFLFNNHIINLRYGYLQQNNSTLDNIEFSYKKVF